MGADWSVFLKQAGIDRDQCIELYGVDSRILNSIDMEFYYAGEHNSDPLGTGANYVPEDITQMMGDIEKHSTITGQRNYLDKQGILADKF